MAAPQNATFSTFVDGGDLLVNDIVVGLRDGLNTRFSFKGEPGVYLPLVGGTMEGAIDMDDNVITGLPAPVSATEAVNKAYADSLVTGETLSKVDDINVTLTLGGTPLTSLLQAVSLTLGWTGQLGVTRGGTGLGSTTINQILYSSSNNVIAGLATANNGVLITSAGGVPSISSTLPSAVQTNITALGAQDQALNMNTHLINNVVDPVSAQDAATKNYVDKTALNGTSVYAASAGTLGTVTQSGSGVGATLTNAGAQATFELDGVNPPVGSNVLIKDTAVGMAAENEGIYIVTDAGSGATNWVLTRATSYDTPTEINNTGLIVVQNGSTLVGTAWYNAATIVTVDTTAFSYSQFGNIIFPVAVTQGGTGLTSTTINQLLYSSANNVIAGLATVNSAGLLTNGSGVPGWVAYTGTGAPVLANSPVLTGTPTIPTPFTLGATSVTSTGTQLNYLNALTAVPINKINVQRFTTPGAISYNPTSGMVYCTVKMVGAGGGGGGATGTVGHTSAGGGGGGGAFAEFLMTAAQVGAGLSGSVGTGGTAGAAAAGTGGTGGDTTFGDWTAAGGLGGVGMTSAATSQLAAGGLGGTLTQGTGTLIQGLDGLVGTRGYTLSTILAFPGVGQANGFGAAQTAGGVLVATAQGPGVAGFTAGTGGGGARSVNDNTDNVGGVGARGEVLVIEYISA